MNIEDQTRLFQERNQISDRFIIRKVNVDCWMALYMPVSSLVYCNNFEVPG